MVILETTSKVPDKIITYPFLAIVISTFFSSKYSEGYDTSKINVLHAYMDLAKNSPPNR